MGPSRKFQSPGIPEKGKGQIRINSTGNLWKRTWNHKPNSLEPNRRNQNRPLSIVISIISIAIGIVISVISTVICISKSILFSSSLSTVSFIRICNCNMNDRGMDNLSMIMAPSWSINQFVHAPNIHVAIVIAVADTDETYGASIIQAEQSISLNELCIMLNGFQRIEF